MLFDIAAVERRNAGELERDGFGRVVRQIRECRDPARDRHRRGSEQRTRAAVERHGHLGRVVTRLQIAVLVLDVDHRLRDERHASRCRRRRFGGNRQADSPLAGLITTSFDDAVVRTGELVNRIVIVSALSSARFVNVAMPPEAVTVVVPCSGPEPSGSDAAVT